MCINYNSATAVADRRPFLDDIPCLQLSRPKFLIIPKHVALRIRLLRDKTVDQSDGFHRFAVVNRTDKNLCLFGELREDRLRIYLVLRRIDGDGRFAFAATRCHNRKDCPTDEDGAKSDADHWTLQN